MRTPSTSTSNGRSRAPSRASDRFGVSELRRAKFRGYTKTWVHAGFTCMVMRHTDLGTYNGYVGLPKGHPYWGKAYDEIPVDVHGGLTFGEQGKWFKERGYLWPNPDLWWMGFDTAHAGDYIPAWGEELGGGLTSEPVHYWTLKKVVAETERLAEQLTLERCVERELG